MIPDTFTAVIVVLRLNPSRQYDAVTIGSRDGPSLQVTTRPLPKVNIVVLSGTAEIFAALHAAQRSR